MNLMLFVIVKNVKYTCAKNAKKTIWITYLIISHLAWIKISQKPLPDYAKLKIIKATTSSNLVYQPT